MDSVALAVVQVGRFLATISVSHHHRQIIVDSVHLGDNTSARTTHQSKSKGLSNHWSRGCCVDELNVFQICFADVVGTDGTLLTSRIVRVHVLQDTCPARRK